MRDGRNQFERLLWGQLLLLALLGAALALFLQYPSLRDVYDLPRLKLVIVTLFALEGLLIAALAATRFTVEGRRFDLLLSTGLFVTGTSWVAFGVIPGIEDHANRTQLWAALGSRTVGSVLIAAAPLAQGRSRRRRPSLGWAVLASAIILTSAWELSSVSASVLPGPVSPGAPVPPALAGALAVQALVYLLATIGYTERYRTRGEDLDRFLALGSLLLLFASLHFVFTPGVGIGDVSQGDFVQVLAYCVLLVGVWRAIRAYEFGRAVADERARLAREIHDGLAQYLFAISTHASMLENGADPAETLPLLRQAADAAQREARYAILALSSASGRSPFDSALRRYVDLLTADGALNVELELDPRVRLDPDEQIEVFRIVQEGLANVRKHASARRAWVRIEIRGGARLVTITDDGTGFETPAGAGQGLGNMRDRATAVGGALSIGSAPGRGTTLEVALRNF